MQKLISVREASATYGISPTHLRRLIRDGKIPAERFGRTFAVEHTAVRYYVKTRRKPGRPRSGA